MKRGKGPQMDSDPRSRPGYNPFWSTGRGRAGGRGRIAKATSIRMAHPLDHRLGAGYQNERAWANMAEDGNPQVNLDRPAEELLDRDDVVLEVQAPPPAASQAKGRPWGPDGAMVDQSWHSIKIWRYGPWAATWKMTPRIGSTGR